MGRGTQHRLIWLALNSTQFKLNYCTSSQIYRSKRQQSDKNTHKLHIQSKNNKFIQRFSCDLNSSIDVFLCLFPFGSFSFACMYNVYILKSHHRPWMVGIHNDLVLVYVVEKLSARILSFGIPMCARQALEYFFVSDVMSLLRYSNRIITSVL